MLLLDFLPPFLPPSDCLATFLAAGFFSALGAMAAVVGLLEVGCVLGEGCL